MTLTIRLISQQRELLSLEAGEVLLPTPLGQIGVLPHHQSLVTVMSAGEVEVREGLGGKLIKAFFVDGGIAEVRNGNEVLLLATDAELAQDIVLEKAQEAKARAQKLLQEQAFSDDVHFADAAAALERSLARLRVAHKHRSHSQHRETGQS